MRGFSSEKLNRRKQLLSILVVLLVAVFSVNLSLAADFTLFAVFYIVAASASAWLVTVKSTLLSLTVSFVSWAASFAITKNPLIALISVSYLPFSLTIPCIQKKKLSRSEAIGVGTACLTIGTVTTLLIMTYVRVGDVSLSSIRTAFPFFFRQVSDILYDSFFVSIAGTKVSLIAESNVTAYLNTIICLFPAALCATMTVVGFIITWLYKKFSEITDSTKFDSEYWVTTPSPVTAVFFIIALITAVLVETVNLISLTAMNFFIIILPFVLLSGLLTSFSPKVTSGIPRPRLFRPLTLIIAVFNGVMPFALLCVFYGLYDSLKQTLSKRKPKKQN